MIDLLIFPALSRNVHIMGAREPRRQHRPYGAPSNCDPPPPCPCSQTCKTGSELGLHLSWSADCGVQNSSMKNDRHGAKNSFPNNVKVKNFDKKKILKCKICHKGQLTVPSLALKSYFKTKASI